MEGGGGGVLEGEGGYGSYTKLAKGVDATLRKIVVPVKNCNWNKKNLKNGSALPDIFCTAKNLIRIEICTSDLTDDEWSLRVWRE